MEEYEEKGFFAREATTSLKPKTREEYFSKIINLCLDIEVLAYELFVDWVHYRALQARRPLGKHHPDSGVELRVEEKFLNTQFDSKRSKNYGSIMGLRNHN